MTTIDSLLRSGAAALSSAPDATSSARLDAEVLLGSALGAPRTTLYAYPEREVPHSVAERYRALLARRATHVPIAYLTGEREFWSLPLRVTRETLIPRPETELLVAQALERLPPKTRAPGSAHRASPTIVDLGTGSGAIGLALASEYPEVTVVATDSSAGALAVARHNATALNLTNVHFVQTLWLASFANQSFDIVVSNPPYVSTADAHLRRGDVAHEPLAALVSGPDGLDALREITKHACRHLNRRGWLLLEHGWDQGASVRMLFEHAGFHAVGTYPDDAGHPRVTAGRRP